MHIRKISNKKEAAPFVIARFIRRYSHQNERVIAIKPAHDKKRG
jgi:hypothetical protein